MTEKTVTVPHAWFHGVQRFMANFTSGNEIPVDVRFVAKRKGEQWAAEATRLRDMLRMTGAAK